MSFERGMAALRAGDLSAAERLFLDIVGRDAQAHAAWHALSIVAVRAGLPDIAVERSRRALALDRDNPDYLNGLGIANAENGDLAAAERALRRALKIRPAHAQAHYNLGTALRRSGKWAEGVREYERALAIDPRSTAVRLDLAQLYRMQGDTRRALGLLETVGEHTFDADLVMLRAQCISDLEGAEAAIAWLRGVLERQPDCQAGHYALAAFLLSLGRWREGWMHHVWRAPGAGRRDGLPPLPERLDGRPVVLLAEQGLGDVLFFLRFVPELRARDAAVSLHCPPQLAKLAPLLGAGIQVREPTPGDLQVPIVDLPSLLQTESVPPAFPLAAEEERCVRTRQRLQSLGPAPYLGLTWRAGRDTRRVSRFNTDSIGPHKLFKEIPPAQLGEALRGWPGTLVSLQREPAPEDLRAVSAAAGAAVHDWASVNDDLRDALAALAALDEYVAVSNTNIHLVAGLGLHGRVLVPHPPEWRWMRAEGESAWFPGFAVYRQSVGLDWRTPLARLRHDLLG